MSQSVQNTEAVGNRARSRMVKELLKKYGIMLAFVLLCVIEASVCQYKVATGAWPENSFLTVNNALLILLEVSTNGILAIGMAFVILAGGIDLSVGSILAFGGMLAASFATFSADVTPWSKPYPVIFAVVFSLLGGLVCGALNGWVVSRFRIQAFIATLGMLLAARGFTMSLTGGNPISSLTPAMRWFGEGKLGFVPVPVIFFVLIFAAAWVVLNRTVFGRYVYALGGNERSAHTSGIHTTRIKMAVYMISGVLAGFAGLILTGRTGSAQTNAGTSYELDAIAAVVIGGTSLTGGVGKLSGTFFGILIIGVMNNGLDLLGVESFYQSIIKGVLIVTAVIIDPSRDRNAN